MPGDRVYLLFDAEEPAVSVRYLTVEAQFKPRWQIFWISERAPSLGSIAGTGAFFLFVRWARLADGRLAEFSLSGS
jgi:hypothetical protein